MRESENQARLIVFDVDDTLYLERDYVASGLMAVGEAVREQWGSADFATIAWRLFVGGQRGNIFDTALTHMALRVTTAQVQELVEVYRTHTPSISLLPDSSAILEELRGKGFKIGVLTDGPSKSQIAKVRALNLYELTDMVVVTDLYGPGYGKPHPKGFIELAEKSRCKDLWYIADNPKKDFQGPASLGWRTIRVRRPGGLHEFVDHEDHVDYLTHNLSESMSIIDARRK